MDELHRGPAKMFDIAKSLGISPRVARITLRHLADLGRLRVKRYRSRYRDFGDWTYEAAEAPVPRCSACGQRITKSQSAL